MNAPAFNVSVVMPVFNAAGTIRAAVESATAIKAVMEVVVVEDGSSDNSLAVCRDLERAFDKVRLLRHADGKNHGCGASCNVGIRNSRATYIAFLDADDLYLPHRFDRAQEILMSKGDIDGVYDAVGLQFSDAESRTRWESDHPCPDDSEKGMVTLRGCPSPEELFFKMAPLGRGFFCTAGIVVRRTVLERVGLFDLRLQQAMDTNLWMRIAATNRLMPGCVDEPVAVYNIHGGNMIRDRACASRSLAEAVLFFCLWASRREVEIPKLVAALECWGMLRDRHERNYRNDRRRVRDTLALVCMGVCKPVLARSRVYKALLSKAIGYYQGRKWWETR